MRTSVTLQVLLFAAGAVAFAQSPGTFTATGNLITAEPYPQATLLSNGKVLVTGNIAEVYDPVSGIFGPTGAIDGRTFSSYTLLADGRVLLAGGSDLADPTSASAELYDPSAGTFTPTGNMTSPRVDPNAVLLNTGKVFIVGGESAGGPLAELYDPDSGTFTACSFPGAGPGPVSATLLADGRVLVIAGAVGFTRPPGLTGLLSNSLAGLYDPATGTFSTIGGGIEASTATLLANGKVLFAGGSSDSGGGNGAYLFDPATESFSATGSMSVARLAQSATLEGDGTVLIAGGQVCPGNGTCPALASAEIYDPAAGTFSTTGSMLAARRFLGAPLLPDGTVLIAGGFGGVPQIPGQAPSTTAEIYHPANPIKSPALFTTSTGQAVVWNGVTGAFASPGGAFVSAHAGDTLSTYTNNLIEGGVLPPQVSVGGRAARILYFGDAPGYPGYFQINFQVPAGVATGSSVPVVLTYLNRSSNAVTIAVQ
jgi:hypothetical protein